MNVEIWSDVVCPWCYLGERRFEHALREVDFRGDVRVVYRSFQLDPSAPRDETVDTTAMLAEKYGLSPERAEAMQQEMERRAAADGLEYHLAGQRSGNTFDAHRLLQLAADRGLGAELAERLFRAYFTEQRSIFDAASLTALAVEIGLDAAEVRDVLAGDRYADAVVADVSVARQAGITGVPFFVFDGRLAVSGAQSAEVLRSALEQAHAEVEPDGVRLLGAARAR